MSLAEEIGREIREKYGTSSHVDEIVQLVKERCAKEAESRGQECAEMHDLVTPDSLTHSIAARIRSL